MLNPLFLHYYLQQSDVVTWISNQAVGATMPNLNTGILRTLPVRFPPLAVQERIAGVLSAYDELMENSQRRIDVLGAIARGLYREWFVHLRFPGYENLLPLAASPLGDIPQGWAITDLADVCTDGNGIQTGPFGSQLHKADYSDQGVPVVMPKDLIGFRIRTDSIARIPEETAEAARSPQNAIG